MMLLRVTIVYSQDRYREKHESTKSPMHNAPPPGVQHKPGSRGRGNPRTSEMNHFAPQAFEQPPSHGRPNTGPPSHGRPNTGPPSHGRPNTGPHGRGFPFPARGIPPLMGLPNYPNGKRL